MRKIAQFEIRPVPAAAGDRSAGRLVFDGRPVGTVVRGACLDAQFALDSGYLLMTTEDIPYEEMLWISLLGSDFDLRDVLELGAPYAPGILRGVQVIADDGLEFSFFGNDRWRLTISDVRMPRLVALLAQAFGISRPSSRRYMRLTRLHAGG
jgi:hypothetical protein